MFILIGKKVIAIIRSKDFLIWTNEEDTYTLLMLVIKQVREKINKKMCLCARVYSYIKLLIDFQK